MLRPKLDATKRRLKCLNVLVYKLERKLGHTTAIKTSHSFLVTVAQNIVIKQVLQVFANFFVFNSCEKHIDIDTAELHLDHRNLSFLYFSKLSDLWCCS